MRIIFDALLSLALLGYHLRRIVKFLVLQLNVLFLFLSLGKKIRTGFSCKAKGFQNHFSLLCIVEDFVLLLRTEIKALLFLVWIFKKKKRFIYLKCGGWNGSAGLAGFKCNLWFQLHAGFSVCCFRLGGVGDGYNI